MIFKKTNRFMAAIVSIAFVLFVLSSFSAATSQVFQPMTDTGQTDCYSNNGKMTYPKDGNTYYGQDAQYESNPMAYKDNGDATVTDLVTGLIWSKAVDTTKVSLIQAHKIADKMTLGGYSDWRVPNIKELYSLMNFSGNTGFNGRNLTSSAPSNAIPYINTDYFDFRFGNTAGGERYIDAQWLSSTKYVSTTMNGSQTLFGVNFADGRIKGYGYSSNRGNRPEKKFYARYVRGNAYGNNDFKDNNDGTITDTATGLMWMKADSGKGMDWKDALNYAETFEHAGYDDWRLPNAKELQYIVDYTRSPDTTSSAAIDPLFDVSSIKNEKGQKDYPYFWTSTTHLDGPKPGNHAAYISFGRGMGKMRGTNMDVHGAGAQRSDPKSGQGNISRGPQGDWVRVNNYVRLVRGGLVVKKTSTPEIDKTAYPFTIKITDNSTSSQPMNQVQNMPPQGRQPGFAGRNQQSSKGKGFISHLDRDGDGKVSKSEFDGPSHHFTQFDRNQDGYISEDEAPTGPPPQRGMKHQ
jgi:hypothetical protein